ncbi:MAG: CBS domain-containing protein [Gammaproteobacteria bacterium]|nr:CBS domain-containing protein [Gammaproteobacteria bacterium]MBU1653878.1 CBS domain-containing protein [Gammaproteobacteria bacterium]MBU1962590.1 CBS domain-containing protein [Gammaproteobacteria bacterium]
MDIELIEIKDFLARHPPFDHLPEEALDPLLGEILIRYLRRGSSIPANDGEADHLYLVRTGAVALFDDKGKLQEKLGEGDYFIPRCEETGDIGLTGRTEEDSLVYMAPCDVLGRLRKAFKEFDAFFSAGTNERLRKALTGINDGVSLASNNLLSIEVGDLIDQRLVSVESGTSVLQAAQRMTECSVSSLLVTRDGDLLGILTDKDLRRRFICQGLSYETPVDAIMTADPIRVRTDTLGFEALLRMTRMGVHHLPVMEGDQLSGVISTTDLIRFQSAHGPYLVREILRAETSAELQNTARRLPQFQVQLVNGGATAEHIGQAVSSITDALTRRLIQLAEAALGPAPVPYAWVAGGSQARREQTSYSDQDNALILSDALRPEQASYFEHLARLVCDGLNACGFYYCPGDAMATNPKWRKPVAEWRRYFHAWIEKPEPMALMLSSIFFDLRVIHGERGLFEGLQQEVLAKSRKNEIFLAFMAANALTHRPPLGFFRTFVLISDGAHDKTFDIKHRGIVPIIDLARVYALASGSPAVNTLERLRDAAEHRVLSDEGAANMIDALAFIATLRMRHQTSQLRQGAPVDNFLPPDDLSPLERNHLKEAFKVIATLQESLSIRYRVGNLG